MKSGAAQTAAKPSSQSPVKRQIMNKQESQFSTADTDSNDDTVQTNRISDDNVSKTNTLRSRNDSGVNYNGNGSNSGNIASNFGRIAPMSNCIESTSCSISNISDFNDGSMNCDKER